MAFQQYLSSLNFNPNNAGIADRLQAQGQHGRTGISDANPNDWVGMNGVVIPAPAAPSHPKTASARPSMLVPASSSHSEYKWDEEAQCMVWVGRL